MSKKSSKNTKEFRQYSVGDHVLGKVRGYPPWPGMVVDPANVPQAVASEQPPGKKSTFHCVLFFPMGDYAWLHPKDLSSLKRHEVETFLADEGKKRNADLREGYRIALDPNDWLSKNEKSRLATIEAQEQVDELASESEGAGGENKKVKGGKKRKRESDEELAREKKATKSKKDVTEPKKKTTTTTTGGGRSRKNGKSKSVVESEDDGDHVQVDVDAGPSKNASSPPSKKAKRDKDEEVDDSKNSDPQAIIVRDWRHKLQKTFLSHKTLPKPEAMAEIDQLFTVVENYNSMTIEQLQFSKIGKVMRHITAVPDERIPLDGEFKFRSRAKSLVEKWHEILNANKTSVESPTEIITGHVNGKSDERIADEVTQGTKNLDLNGKDDALMGQDTPDLGDESMLAEVTMSEA